MVLRMPRLTAGLMLVTILAAGLTPLSAGTLPGCCICSACADPPATQCFEAPAQGCLDQCALLNCASAADTSIACGEQPQCMGFSAPAPAPALASVGLAVAALLLGGLGLRAMRVRR
jgi:hypothetical protein